jgi:hypothetical protein
LEALDRIDHGTATDASWLQQKSAQLDIYGKASHETQIAVIPEIAELVIGHVVPEPTTYPAF